MSRVPKPAVAVLSLSLLLGACALRSISDAGYRDAAGANPLYRGEVHDLDVIGSGGSAPAAGVTLRAGARLLVMQSGALMPDQTMLDALEQAGFRTGFLSGIPYDVAGTAPAYREVAARGGYDAILCYWGVLETARTDNAGKALSWVPIAGFFVPDEDQRMRIRLKLVVVDVATGGWTMVLPGGIDDTRASAFVTRASSDQEQVAALKQQGYAAASEQLVAQLVR